MTIVDTNIVLDLLTGDSVWLEWSRATLRNASASGTLFINDVVYAELSARFPSVEALDRFVHDTRLECLPIARAGLFLAGKAFARYRALGGTRTGVLPDFFIGAQAATTNLPLITRDAQRYRTYFPTVVLITPPTA